MNTDRIEVLKAALGNSTEMKFDGSLLQEDGTAIAFVTMRFALTAEEVSAIVSHGVNMHAGIGKKVKP